MKDRICVLLVDDDDMVRETLADILANRGFQVTCASNGEECLELLTRGRFDVVVTDIIMPQKEGLETIAAIRRARYPAKIIAMSGGGRTRNRDFLEIARRFGADRTFVKPVEFDFLAKQIETLACETETAA